MKNLRTLLESIKRRDAAVAKRILVEYPYLFHYEIPYEWPLIHRCIESDCMDVELVGIYIQIGANINRKTEGGLSILGLATRKLYTGALIDKLREVGANQSGFEECVSILANETNHARAEKSIRALIAADAKIINTIGDGGRTLLHHSVSNGLLWAVRLFVSEGCPVNAVSSNGLTALDTCPAVSTRDKEIQDLLLEQCAKRTELGEIVYFMRSGRTADVVSRLRCSPRLCHAWFPGLGPLILVTAWLAPDDQVLRLLLESGVDPNDPNENGDTALHMAWKRGETVKILLNYGADATTQNNNGDTPLHKAVSLNNTEPILVLLDHGVGINILNESGETALDIVGKMRYPDFRQLTKMFRARGGKLKREI